MWPYNHRVDHGLLQDWYVSIPGVYPLYMTRVYYLNLCHFSIIIILRAWRTEWVLRTEQVIKQFKEKLTSMNETSAFKITTLSVPGRKWFQLLRKSIKKAQILNKYFTSFQCISSSILLYHSQHPLSLFHLRLYHKALLWSLFGTLGTWKPYKRY